jgi:hypothetical protein
LRQPSADAALERALSNIDAAQDMLSISDTWFASDLIMDFLFTFDVFLRFFTAVRILKHISGS